MGPDPGLGWPATLGWSSRWGQLLQGLLTSGTDQAAWGLSVGQRSAWYLPAQRLLTGWSLWVECPPEQLCSVPADFRGWVEFRTSAIIKCKCWDNFTFWLKQNFRNVQLGFQVGQIKPWVSVTLGGCVLPALWVGTSFLLLWGVAFLLWETRDLWV